MQVNNYSHNSYTPNFKGFKFTETAELVVNSKLKQELPNAINRFERILFSQEPNPVNIDVLRTHDPLKDRSEDLLKAIIGHMEIMLKPKESIVDFAERVAKLADKEHDLRVLKEMSENNRSLDQQIETMASSIKLDTNI